MNVTSTLIRAFAPWMTHLREYIFRQSAAANAALGPLMPVLYNYLDRLTRRLDRLVLAWERDRLPARRAVAPRAASRPASARKALRLPTRQNWLHLLHQPFVYYRGGVERLLEDPDTRALFEAAPQAGRLLRPLCRHFGVPLPAWLRLPPRPRTPKPPKPPRAPRELPFANAHPISGRFFDAKTRRRLRRLGQRFKTGVLR